MKELTPKFCPACGQTLIQQACANPNCKAFGIAVKLKMESQEVKVDAPATDNELLNVFDRQLTALLNNMSKEQPTVYWKQLQNVASQQLSAIQQCLSELCQVEKALRSTPLTNSERDKALANLNYVAAKLLAKANFASQIGQDASRVVLADINLEDANNQLAHNNAEYQYVLDQEGKAT